MLKPNDRFTLECVVINTLLQLESFFLKLYDFNPVAEDLFRNLNNQKIYEIALDCFVERGYPTASEVFVQMILSKSPEAVKNHFIKNIVTAEVNGNFDVVRHLLEDSIEQNVREAISGADKKNYSGLQFAEFLREETDSIILRGFEKYKRDIRTNKEKTWQVLENIKRIREGKTSDYIPTGITNLDEAIIGIPKGHVTTIAARPGMGKTSLMLQLRRNLVESGYKPLIISIEMSSEQLLIKELSAYSKIDSRKIESGNINEEENKKITMASSYIEEDNYFIEDDGFWTLEKLKSTIRRHLAKHKIDCVFVDYLTLLRFNTKISRYDLAIGEATNSLRELAKDTGLPIVILSQLNRDCEKRNDKKPILADLRESGSIEQDSKTVLFLFRPAYYGIDYSKDPGGAVAQEWYTKDGKLLANEEYSEIIVAKARSGKTGIVHVRYQPAIHTFENLKGISKENLGYRKDSIRSRYYEIEDDN